jgi:hypothetical protein
VCPQTFGEEHPDIEVLLDRLLSGNLSEAEIAERFRVAHEAVEAHYEREDPLFERLLPRFTDVCSKMLRQHADALEIAVQAEISLQIGQMADALALIRRFHAIAQHNIIEEERDVFPLLARHGGGPPPVE